MFFFFPYELDLDPLNFLRNGEEPILVKIRIKWSFSISFNFFYHFTLVFTRTGSSPFPLKWRGSFSYELGVAMTYIGNPLPLFLLEIALSGSTRLKLFRVAKLSFKLI